MSSLKNLIPTWFDEIATSGDDETKIENIAKIKQYFLDQKDPRLEIAYFQELLSYSSDINNDVRESIADFIEEAAGNKFQEKIPDLLPPLSRLVSDPVPKVSKRGIRASSWVLKAAYRWIVDASKVKITKEIQEVWNHLNFLKSQIINMVESENEGVRMQAIKFIENVVLFQTYLDPETPKSQSDFSLNDMLFTLEGTCCRNLEEEACRLVETMINYLQSSFITSIYLITSMGALGQIAKLRPKFTAQVIEAIIRLRKDLPPTLSASQIVGIKKESMRLIKILTSNVKIKQEPRDNCNSPVKRPLEQPKVDSRWKKLKLLQKDEISDDLIVKNLTVNTEMVIDAIARVPGNITPEEFEKKNSGFSVSADPEIKRRVIAKSLVMTQLKQSNELHNDKIDSEFIKLKSMKNIVSLSSADKQIMLVRSIDRIISYENSILTGQHVSNKIKILVRMATINVEIKKLLLIYISEDVKNRIDLALSMVYEEYALNHGFKRKIIIAKTTEGPFQLPYNYLLSAIIKIIESHPDRAVLLTRFYLAVPVISKEMIRSLTTKTPPETLTLLKELVFRRTTNKLEFLNILLGLTTHQDSSISDPAVDIILGLYNHGELRQSISEYLKANLNFLRLKNPPQVLLRKNVDRKMEHRWANSMVQSCLKLYQALLKEDKSLIYQLVKIYPLMTVDVKTSVKILMERSIRCFGANSPELLRIVETCPEGAESLVTRFVHTLTENRIPSSELVARMQKIYETRSLDIVFLIPVVRGLSREQVFSVLPKLITRNTLITKEVIKRLFFIREYTEFLITPVEFMITVHNFKKDVTDLKTIMICISMCLAEKKIFTQEVLQIVVSCLLDQTCLPITLMRTVMQILSLYPEMEKFVLSVLKKLILKKVWELPKLWQGFAKCCEMLKEKSFAVIHQLPQESIDNLFKIVPGLKNDYIDYLKPNSNFQRDNNNEIFSSKAVPFVSIV
ncbi:GSCOCG00007511001-RA-CDS [Cotesia congregata]|uniref:Similar to SYMPK: Symplekin (Homo sapiens) n=1 Tax=Cotesia congregata TaxID=51543 RepID=A0A8J2MXC7_COTCN|nr:GSCOCG00007511001-RA-CDS [Cotesia congregata]CAG5101581.1 Similar to SYMPK: Symplekin (Homo sapiens) [Cotesia congregata]